MVKEQEQILRTYVVDNVLKVGVRDLNLTLGGVIVLCFWARLFSLGPSFQVAGLNDTKLVIDAVSRGGIEIRVAIACFIPEIS